MDLLQIIILALIQGITEFLPISSSAHLILPSQLFGWPDQGLAFDVATHVGTLLAVIIYFRQDLINLTRGWITQGFSQTQSDDSRLAWLIVLATVPAGLAGLLLGDYIEQYCRSSWVIATTTLLFAFLLAYADKTGSFSKNITQLTITAALIIGLFQMLALIPGTSRSGITITAALLLGLQRDCAARFSFLLSVPLILAAGGLKTIELIQADTLVNWADLGLAALLSALGAYACIYLFLAMINRIGMMPFVYYRLALSALLFTLLGLA